MFQVKKIYDSHNYQTGTYAKIINQKGEEVYLFVSIDPHSNIGKG